MNSKTSQPCLIACMLVMLPVAVTCQDPSATAETIASKMPFKLRPQESYAIEISCIALAVAILVNMYIGKRKNEKLAVRYVAELVRSDGVVQKQFAEAESQVVIEAPDVFKFYATGRRYCQGALFTFRMASRQDLLSRITKSGQRDVLDIEVNMNENAMPATVIFIGAPMTAKITIKENRDIADLAKKLEPTRDRLGHWPSDALTTHAEQTSVFYDVITPAVMEALFGPASWSELSKYFRYLHASTDYRVEGYVSDKAVGSTERRSVIKMSLYLPPPGNMELLDKFVTLLGLLIDGLGTCKLSGEQAKRAADARHKAEQNREDAKTEKEKRLEERRLQKEAEERARLAKLPPEQREKERAKREKLLRQRRIRSMIKKL